MVRYEATKWSTPLSAMLANPVAATAVASGQIGVAGSRGYGHHLAQQVAARVGVVEPPSAVAAVGAVLHRQDGTRFYSGMYAGRAIPLGLVTALAPWVASGLGVVLLFVVAALAQAVDVLRGVVCRIPGMIAGDPSAPAATVRPPSCCLRERAQLRPDRRICPVPGFDNGLCRQREKSAADRLQDQPPI